MYDSPQTWILSFLSSSSCRVPEVSALSANLSLALASHAPRSLERSRYSLWSATLLSHFFRMSCRQQERVGYDYV